MTEKQTGPRPRTKPAEIRREELMDAAQRLFLKKGFAATSVDEIVRDADVAKGTFYLHFPSKDDVMTALQQRFVASFLERVDTAVSVVPAGDHAGRLFAWASGAIGAYLDLYHLHDLVFRNFMPIDRRMKRGNRGVADLQALLEMGEKDGAWSLPNARMTAVMLFNAMHGAVDDALGETERPERAPLIAEVNGFFGAVMRIAPKAEA